MRSLQRNWRTIRYANPQGTEPIYDDYGNETLEYKTVYSEPVELDVNVSANVGEDTVNVFGSQTEYSRTVTYIGATCPLVEGSKVWFGTQEYIVVKVADSKNGCLIALREVSNSG